MVENLRIQHVDGKITIPGYHHISGADIKGPVAIVAAHIHVKDREFRKDDGIQDPEEYLYRALSLGIDELIPTGHNSFYGFERMLRQVANQNLPLQLTPAVECDAQEDGRAMHVIGLGASYVPHPGKTVLELNTAFHRQEGDVATVAAHPDLGDYSVPLVQVEEMKHNKTLDPEQQFDGVEYNGGSRRAYQLGKKALVRPLRRFIPEIPDYDLNQATIDFANHDPIEHDVFLFGGGDVHFGPDLADVLMLRPQNKTTVAASRAKEVMVFAIGKPPPVNTAYLRQWFFVRFGV